MLHNAIVSYLIKSKTGKPICHRPAFLSNSRLSGLRDPQKTFFNNYKKRVGLHFFTDICYSAA